MGIESEDELMADGSGSAERRSGAVPRLFIKEMVMRNFKSYAGQQSVGPFHKVRVPVSPKSKIHCIFSNFII